MKEVAPLRYGVIFKKAFGQVDIFKAFVKDIIGIELDIDKVETEKSFSQQIGNVKVEFDLYAEDIKNRVIVEIQHQNGTDHYDRFLHYHCVALLEQAANSKSYSPQLSVYTIVVLTSGDNHKTDVAVIDFDPKDKNGKGLGVIKHKVIYLAAKYVDDNTPLLYREWLNAINESLTERIEESNYSRPELQKVISLIAKNLVSPEDKYQMIEEYNFEQAKKERFDKGVETGVKLGIEQSKLDIAKAMLQQGFALDTIRKLTGLSAELITHINFE
jgi:predicted transposase/invertase (TIGR01784 family)